MQLLITGVTSGIGQYLLEIFSKTAETIDVIVRNENQKTKLQSLYGKKLTIHVADLSNPHEIDEIAKTLSQKMFSHVVLNAGYAKVGFIHDVSREDTENIFQANLFSNITLLRHMAPGLNIRGATVCFVSSLVSLMPGKNYAAYGMSKCALSYFSKALSIEYPNIKTLCAEIGGVNTPLHIKSNSGYNVKNFRRPDKVAQRLYKAITKNRRGIVTLYPDWYLVRFGLHHLQNTILNIRRIFKA